MNTLLSIANAADRAAISEQNFQTLDELLIPIGGCVLHFAGIAGVPPLTDRFKACDGTAVADAESPLNGENVPNLAAIGGGTWYMRIK